VIRFEIGVQEAEKAKLQNDPVVKERFQTNSLQCVSRKQFGKRIEDLKITEMKCATINKRILRFV